MGGREGGSVCVSICVYERERKRKLTRGSREEEAMRMFKD